MTSKASQECILVQGVPETGDSLMRLLLNIPEIQTDLASCLLEQLPLLSKSTEGGGGDDPSPLPQLVLGSLRWYAPCSNWQTLHIEDIRGSWSPKQRL